MILRVKLRRKPDVRPGRKPQRKTAGKLTKKQVIGLMSGLTSGCLKVSKRLVGKIIPDRKSIAGGPVAKENCNLSRSRNGTLWNLRLHQSALAPENLITLAHFSVSVAMNLAKSEDEPGNTAAPRSANRAFNLRSTRPALISLLSLSTISAGVSLGAPMPCSALAS